MNALFFPKKIEHAIHIVGDKKRFIVTHHHVARAVSFFLSGSLSTTCATDSVLLTAVFELFLQLKLIEQNNKTIRILENIFIDLNIKNYFNAS
jgi:hypothetical protein